MIGCLILPRTKHVYVDGRPYRSLHTRFRPEPDQLGRQQRHIITLKKASVKWQRFWVIVRGELKRHDYSTGTIKVYRQVLRSFVAYLGSQSAKGGQQHSPLPGRATQESAKAFIYSLVDRHSSRSWISTSISVLRTAFDKLGGLNITSHLATPKRPGRRLPTILSVQEARSILAAAPSTRDRLLLGLMYGCGLKPGEVCRLRWKDIDPDKKTIRVLYGRGTQERTVAIPMDLYPVLKEGVSRCATEDYVFAGNRKGQHLSTRMAELILKKAHQATEVAKPISCMTMRHSYAVHCLEAGATIRQVQTALGHELLETTQMYSYCILPKDVTSPLDTMAARHEAGATTAKTESEEKTGNEDPEVIALFDEPLTVQALEIPFASDLKQTSSWTSAVRGRNLFSQLMKTHIGHRYLALRRAASCSSKGERGP